MNLELFKRKSKTQRVIELMQRKQGATNGELNNIMFRYGSIICNLRKDGHKIMTEYGKGSKVTYRMEN